MIEFVFFESGIFVLMIVSIKKWNINVYELNINFFIV